MARQIALLRGINVGRAKRVGMAPLREVFAELGCTEVKTYVNSGNVVFSGRKASPAKIEQAIAAAFGLDVRVVVRTRDELAGVIAADPMGEAADNPSRYLVSFSGDGPIDPARADGVEPGPGERWAIRGSELYLWMPDGLQASRLVGQLTEKRLGVTLTARNWRTVQKLLEMADAGG